MKELFGQRLREQRIKHGLTLEQLAEKSELSSNYIGMVERGLKEPGLATILDTDTSPEVRREAALLAQKELAKCMQEWGISFLNAPVPEQMKYASLAEAASHLMQVLNDPEHITG